MLSLSALKAYFDNSSIHGLPHITNRSKRPIERCFWVVVCLLAIYITYTVITMNGDRYEHDAVSFVVETDYINWNTTFPSFSVCEKETHSQISKAAEKIYGPERNLNIEIFVRDIAFYDGTCKTCRTTCLTALNCSEDLEYITKMARKSCRELIHRCEWLGHAFDCCEEFLPLQTEIGPCFSINSHNTVRSHSNYSQTPLDFRVNRLTGPGELSFMIDDEVYLFLHSSDDVPTISHPHWEKATVSYGTEFIYNLKVKEIVNDPQLRGLRLEQRNCQFADENMLQSYKVYSYSGCVVEHRSTKQYELCGCIDHFMPKIRGMKTCNFNGLRCLAEHTDELRHAKFDCAMSCVAPEYDVFSHQISNERKFDLNENGKSRKKIVLKLAELPNMRFKRIVVRSLLDFVVGIGGACGLFLGASILSTLEIPYFLFIRKRVEKINRSQ